ncbi:hypothetical protein GGR26_002492 [Lewinella marina]|uniref:Outer membrane protein beta-barrel domain-containing protein n=1 Tax=Neolewinella marina TaxID=438751 RepID=A0A2G0CC48_9BACT|nr:hypothetical protein [Neolewinella marina]NJB86715.1 hypothetical protein [Neolewinella marina]PHK97522.1 hypothetical protein CGL56_15600 [Neolewinella marina]
MNVCKCLALAILFTLFGGRLVAQEYDEAIGVRFGYPLSVSYKAFVNASDAVEVYAGWRGWRRYRALSIHGAYLIHQDFPDVNHLQWYYGAGAGLQFWNYDEFDRGSSTVSLSGYLGVEYVFTDTPISISADWRPTIYLGTQRAHDFHNFSLGSGALAVRYLLPRKFRIR